MSLGHGTAERHITVHGTAAQVWALVSVPAWFISSRPGAPEVEKIDDQLTLIHDTRSGLRLIRTVELAKPSYVAFQWEAPEDPWHLGTLIEFWVTDNGDGTALLTVRESGLTDEMTTNDRGQKVLEENEEAWAEALDHVRALFE